MSKRNCLDASEESESNIPPWNTLPTEIWLLILECLPIDALYTMKKTSTFFHACSNTAYYRQTKLADLYIKSLNLQGEKFPYIHTSILIDNIVRDNDAITLQALLKRHKYLIEHFIDKYQGFLFTMIRKYKMHELCGIISSHSAGWLLCSAVSFGNIDMINEIIEIHKVHVDIQRGWRCSPLVIAVESHRFDIVELLITKHNANVDTTPNGLISVLHIACAESTYEILELLLAHGANPDIEDTFGNTPLHRSALSNKTSRVQLLLDYHANINAKNEDWNTPLHLAILERNVETVELLCNRRADVNIPNVFDQTPVHLALLKESCSIWAYVAAVPGANLTIKDRKGQRGITNALRTIRHCQRKLVRRRLKHTLESICIVNNLSLTRNGTDVHVKKVRR